MASQVLGHIIKRFVKVNLCASGSPYIYAVSLFEIKFINLPTFFFSEAEKASIPTAYYITSKLTLSWLISIRQF